jgi:WD40 repeat protein
VVKEVEFSPDSNTLGILRLPMGFIHMPVGGFGQTARGSLELWEVANGRRRGPFQVPPTSRAPAFLPDGKALVWMEQRGKVFLAVVDNAGQVRPFGAANPQNQPLPLAVAPDGKTLAMAPEAGIQLWDVASRQEGRGLEDSANTACLAFSGDGQTLAAATGDGAFQLWKVASGKKHYQPFPGHRGWISCVAYSTDRRTVATGSFSDGTIRLWDVGTGKEIRCWEAHRVGSYPKSGPLSLTFSPDGKTLASGGHDQVLRLWEVSTGKEIRHFREEQQPGSSHHLRFSPDGKTLASMTQNGTVRLWTIEGEEVRRFQEPDPSSARLRISGAQDLAFSADGKFLAASRGKVIRLWETATGREAHRFEGHTGMVCALAFSPDGRTLASAALPGTPLFADSATPEFVRLWDVATGKERRLARDVPDKRGPQTPRQTQPDGRYITALGFFPDGRTLVGGGSDGVIYVWDLTKDTPAHKAYGHKEMVTCLALCPDGQRLASASGDHTALVWNLADLKRAGR